MNTRYCFNRKSQDNLRCCILNVCIKEIQRHTVSYNLYSIQIVLVGIMIFRYVSFLLISVDLFKNCIIFQLEYTDSLELHQIKGIQSHYTYRQPHKSTLVNYVSIKAVLHNFSCNFSRNCVATQVARQIAWCNIHRDHQVSQHFCCSKRCTNKNQVLLFATIADFYFCSTFDTSAHCWRTKQIQPLRHKLHEKLHSVTPT